MVYADSDFRYYYIATMPNAGKINQVPFDDEVAGHEKTLEAKYICPICKDSRTKIKKMRQHMKKQHGHFEGGFKLDLAIPGLLNQDDTLQQDPR